LQTVLETRPGRVCVDNDLGRDQRADP